MLEKGTWYEKTIGSEHFLLNGLMACALMILGATVHVQQATPAVTAIDILLEPNATMLQHAQAVNDRLITVFRRALHLTPYVQTN